VISLKDTSHPAQVARFESFEANLRSGELYRNGERVKLPDQSFQILAMLLSRPGEVVMRQEIQKVLWPNDTVVEFENSINAAIKRLRIALGDSADEPRFIETLARRGYRWKMPVEWDKGNAQAPVMAGAIPTTSSLIGKRVSHYRVLEILGGGGMGVVYKAEDIKLGRRAALKFLPDELAGDPRAAERFEREARAASTLNHPNICTIYEVDEDEGRPFIVMELLEGQTLRDFIAAQATSPANDTRSHALPLPMLLEFATQMAEGLEAAHRSGIVHRDIKPANIFITAGGRVKILDFGLAKLEREIGGMQALAAALPDQPVAAANPSLTLTGSTMGTAGYMSPEQVRGEKLDARSDLFCFGLVLYEMATGQRAFTGENATALHHAIVESTPASAIDLNPDISPGLQRIISKALEKDREVRYQSASELGADLKTEAEAWRRNREVGSPTISRLTSNTNKSKIFGPRFGKIAPVWLLGATVVIGMVIAWRLLPQRSTVLAGSDLVIVDDFINATGDPIFDGTLKQALTVKLAESPYFNLVPESKLTETIRLMGRSPGERILPPWDREVCQRAGAKIAVSGAIVSVGDQYRISLRAFDCSKGSEVDHEETDAQNRDLVLRSLGRLISPLRGHLGELVASMQKFDTPIEQATTKSLPALKAYTSGDQHRAQGLDGRSISYYKMAIDLDPNFAMAYARLGAIYSNLANAAVADEYLAKAFERREHVSEREKFYITSHYYSDSTRETDKAIETLILWTQTYPHEWIAYNNLASEALQVGNLEQAVKAGQEALRLNPAQSFAYLSLAHAYIETNRYAEARAVCDQAVKSGLESSDLHAVLLTLAILRGEEAELKQQLDWVNANATSDPGFMNLEAGMMFTLGKVHKAREFAERSRALSLGRGDDTPLDSKYYAAFVSGNEAQLEAELGNEREARRKAELALRLMPESVEAQTYAGLVFANLGDYARAERLMKALKARFPLSTLLNNVTLPAIQATIDIKKKNYHGAIETLRRSASYDLGSHQDLPEGITMYLRGSAYLGSGLPMDAAAQFQNLLDHRGLIALSPYWPMAHLGLARAYAMAGETDHSLAEYQEVLSFWHDADPELPLLGQARAEYSMLLSKRRAS
jgi:serine/threonine protein kinase/tetratricopeptide (TPR) repeat protein